MKYKDGNVWKEINIKALDSLPVGTQISYTGSEVPAGWQQANDYSTTEMKTGMKWKDGRPIYRKVIETTSPSSANSWTQIATISNLRDIIKLEGWVYASNERILPIQFSEPNAEIATTVLYNGIEMKVMLSNWCNASCMMIAEYTKTTD